MNLLAWMRRRASQRRDRQQRPEVTAFQTAAGQLTAGDIAIDCGANVGKFTTMMAQGGATVHAFEPNPDAVAALRRNLAAFPQVHVHPTAVTTAPGAVKLYLHKWADEDPVHWSTGSSLLAKKNNVREDRFALVEGTPFAAFVRTLAPGRIRLLKMDIEGVEVDVINQLLDEGLHTMIDQAFVETHDRRVPELVEPTRQLRSRLAAMGVDHFRLDWR